MSEAARCLLVSECIRKTPLALHTPHVRLVSTFCVSISRVLASEKQTTVHFQGGIIIDSTFAVDGRYFRAVRARPRRLAARLVIYHRAVKKSVFVLTHAAKMTSARSIAEGPPTRPLR